jgi:hypothetical protein
MAAIYPPPSPKASDGSKKRKGAKYWSHGDLRQGDASDSEREELRGEGRRRRVARSVTGLTFDTGGSDHTFPP